MSLGSATNYQFVVNYPINISSMYPPQKIQKQNGGSTLRN